VTQDVDRIQKLKQWNSASCRPNSERRSLDANVYLPWQVRSSWVITSTLLDVQYSGMICTKWEDIISS